MTCPTAKAPLRVYRRRGCFIFALSFLAAVDVCAEPTQGRGNTDLPLEISFESISATKLKLQKQQPSGDQQKASPVEEADKTFMDNYDAEKIANYYGTKYQRDIDYLLTIIYHTATAAKENNVSPFILLAIISHESNFLHTARNNSGAAGLMQIMPSVHKKRFERFGGVRMSFVPEVNIRVGAAILRDCIGIMKSVSGGLRCYAGTINSDDGGFISFVLGEARMIKRIASRTPTEAAQ